MVLLVIYKILILANKLLLFLRIYILKAINSPICGAFGLSINNTSYEQTVSKQTV